MEREFDFSSDRQGMANIGPTPEGLYSLSKKSYSESNKSGYQSYDDLSPFQKLLSTVGRGLWPGGENSWREHRWGLQKEEVNSSRKDMYLHGGGIWGSRGCIDCGQGISRFFNVFMKNNLGNNKVYLKVAYPSGFKYRLYNLPAN